MFWLGWGRRYSSQKCTASQICLEQPARDTTKTHSSRGTVMLLSSYTYRWHSQQRRNCSALAMELLSFALSHGFDYHTVCVWYTSNILALFRIEVYTVSAHGYAVDVLTLMTAVIGSAQSRIFDIGRRRSNIVPIGAAIYVSVSDNSRIMTYIVVFRWFNLVSTSMLIKSSPRGTKTIRIDALVIKTCINRIIYTTLVAISGLLVCYHII